MNGNSAIEVRIAGVIVSYKPDHQALLDLIEAIRPQVSELLIVNNGIAADLPPLPHELLIEAKNLGDNHGIAHAQNVGIQHVLTGGATHVLLLDQDSIPAPDMVQHLLLALERLQAAGKRVAAVGPCYTDERQGEAAPFVYRKCLSIARRPMSAESDTAEADFLIASGCLIPAEAFARVGLMEEAMFIDYVDIEWGLRAQMLGIKSFGVYTARMQHSLGDEWFSFRGRRIPVHSALRHYYHFRNALWLCRRPWISTAWRVILLYRLLKQFAFFSIIAEDRGRQIRMMTLGIWHGLRNRMGKL